MNAPCVPESHDVSISLKDALADKELGNILYDWCRDVEFMCICMELYADTVGNSNEEFNAFHSMVAVFVGQMKAKRLPMVVLRDFFDTTANAMSLRDLETLIAERRAKEARKKAHA